MAGEETCGFKETRKEREDVHALIRKGDGQYYISTVFGYYQDVHSEDDYQRYLERMHSPYYVVWDEMHRKLVKCFALQPNTIYIHPLVLIVDTDESGWILDEEGCGGLAFLPRILADHLIEEGNLPVEIYRKCLEADGDYVYEEYREIQTEKDIEDFRAATRGFHDAWIIEEKLQEDGKLYLLFDGVWGCNVEIWFWGDLEYDTSSRHQENSDPFWFYSTLLIQDGFIYFVDDEEMTVDEITEEYCYFKARHMMYHLIPD